MAVANDQKRAVLPAISMKLFSLSRWSTFCILRCLRILISQDRRYYSNEIFYRDSHLERSREFSFSPNDLRSTSRNADNSRIACVAVLKQKFASRKLNNGNRKRLVDDPWSGASIY